MIQRWLFSLIGIGLIGVIGGSLFTREPRPATLLATPTPIMSTPVPSPTTQSFTPNQSVLDVGALVDLQLPSGWHLTKLERTTLANQLQTVAQNPKAGAGEAASLLQTNLASDTSMIAAASVEPTPASLTLFAFTRNELSLERYLEDAQSLLQGAGGQIESVGIQPGIRGDQLPVGTLRYTLADGSGQSGLQVVTFDASTTRLIVFTFTASSTSFEQLTPQFEEIVRSARFLPAA